MTLVAVVVIVVVIVVVVVVWMFMGEKGRVSRNISFPNSQPNPLS